MLGTGDDGEIGSYTDDVWLSSLMASLMDAAGCTPRFVGVWALSDELR